MAVVMGCIMCLNLSAQDKALEVVDQMPRFPGCENMRAPENIVQKCAEEKMMAYIFQNLKYPEEAKKAGIEGMAVVQFVVGKKGAVKDIEVVRDIDGHFENTVTQLIQEMPLWNPGRDKGQAVNVKMTLPLKFRLDGDKEANKHAMGKGHDGEMKDKKMEKGKRMGKVSPFKNNGEGTTGSQSRGSDVPPPPPPPPPAPSTHEREIFKIVEQMPRFPGCEEMLVSDSERSKCAKEKMLKYLYSTMRYPAEAREQGVEGKAIVRFVVEPDGSITNAELLRDPGAGTGAEALRVVNTMQDMPDRWIAGKQRGRSVAVQYNMPILFKLESDGKGKKMKPKSRGATTTVEQVDTESAPTTTAKKKRWWQFWKKSS